MKTLVVNLALLSIIGACHPSFHSKSSEQAVPGNYRYYNNLAEALRSHPGLSVRGDGAIVDIRLSRYSNFQNSGPLYVVNEIPLGNDYSRVNESLDMSNVRSIRIIIRTNQLIKYGSRGKYGVISITTMM